MEDIDECLVCFQVITNPFNICRYKYKGKAITCQEYDDILLVAKPIKPIKNKMKRCHCCDVCEKLFLSKWDLRRHIQTVHEKRRNEKCFICQKTFGQKGTLNRHIRYIHTK